jgi:hypothetical protein
MPSEVDLEARLDSLWRLYADIVEAKATVTAWERVHSAHEAELADPSLLYLEMLDRAYGTDKRAGLRTALIMDKDDLLQSVKLTFAGLSRARWLETYTDEGRVPPEAEDFDPFAEALARRDQLIKEYLDNDARVRQEEEDQLRALQVSIARLKLEIAGMEKGLAARAQEIAAAVTGSDSGPRRYNKPTWQGLPVDNCLYFARQCNGQDAAAEFCRLRGWKGVADQKVDANDPTYQHPVTVILGEKERLPGGGVNPRRRCSPKGPAPGSTVSPSGKCVGFVYIECE